jgi:integrase
MSSQAISRVKQNAVATLAEVVAALHTAALPARRKQEISAALNTVTRALKKPPERISADPRRLAPLLASVAPLAIGISAGRWANVRSLTRAGLALVQPMSPGRHIIPLSPGWKALWRQLASRRAKMALSRFARFCTVRGIEPAAVTEATVEAFRAHLDNTLLKNPDKIFAALVRALREAQTAVESWPRLDITIPNRRNEWTLTWAHFPASLQQECVAWCDRLAGRDLLEEAPFRPVKSTTVERRRWQIRAFASALVLRGRDPRTITSLIDLVEIEAFKEGLRFFIERSGGKATQAVYDFAVTLKALARHHLQVEKAHLDRMAAVIRRLDVGNRGLTEKNRTRLRQFDGRQQAVALLRLPIELIGIAARNRKAHAGALQAQAAVAIEILLMAPLRLGNLTRLDLEQNLIRPGPSKEIFIVIEAEHLKNRQAVDYPLPTPSCALIERYLAEFRPRLAPVGCTALFPGRGGGPKSLNALRDLISKTVHRYTGMRVHPHLFRHAAAKLYLDANPGAYEVVRRVLGHRSINTTTAFYTGLETGSAIRHFEATILHLRTRASA